jgi:TonB-linked SusC/RagA family outer membrane protein
MKRTKTWWLCLALLLCITTLTAQDLREYAGVVRAANGEPLEAVTISLVNRDQILTTTDASGNFKFNARPDDIVQFTAVGYATQKITLGSQTQLPVTLEVNISMEDQVVVVGYGTIRSKVNTGSTVRVGGESLSQNHATNTLSALQGQAPGVHITSRSGQPGDAMVIRIRGISTNGNSNPLYVVDGMQTDDISYLNPSDIESLDVLKDAASAAIYGTRGANGVVLITTKKAKAGVKNIQYDGLLGWQNPAKKLDLLNANEYAVIMNEAAMNSGRGPNYFFSDQQMGQLGKGTDWQDAAYHKNALLQQHSLTFNQGNDQSVLSAGLGYQKTEGIIGMPGKSQFERISFRLNSEHKLYKDIIRFGENFTYTHTTSSGIGTGNIYGNSLRGLLNTSPTFPVYDVNGDYAFSTMSPEEANPVAAMDFLNNNKNVNDKLFGDLYLEVELIKGLKLRSNFGIDLTYGTSNRYTPVYYLSANNNNALSEANQGMNKNFMWNWDNTINYQRKFNEHSVNLLVGTTAQETTGFYVSGSKQDLIIPHLDFAIIDNGKEGTQKAWGGRYESALNAYFGRVNYAYKDKYLLTGIVRRDASTNFGVNNRWATFSSFSLGWVVTEESFMDGVNWLSFFKVRGGWGQNGNDRIRSYAYMATVSSLFRNYYFGGISGEPSLGASPDIIPNPNLRWETAEQLNIGFDATILNKLNVTVDWYNKSTKDWLVEAPIPQIVGTGAPVINGGDIVNRGVEVLVNYNTTVGKVKLNIGGNIAFNDNTVKSVPTADGIIHGGVNLLSSTTEEFFRIQNGHPVGYFWGYRTDGIFQNQDEVNAHAKGGNRIQPNAVPGDVRFVDVNGDGVISALDKVQIGSPIPKFTYGFHMNAQWNGFDVAVLFSGVYGNDIVNGTRANDRFFNNYPTSILNRWHGEGTSNSIPRVTLGDEPNRNYANVSDLYIQDGSFLRLKSLNIGYDLTKKLLQKRSFQLARVYVSGLNLLTFTKYRGIDPEIGYGDNNWSTGIDLGYYPQARTISVGVQFKL